MIGATKERQAKGVCTAKQAGLLRKFGEDTKVSFSEASKIISEIQEGGWSPRDAVVEKTMSERVASSKKGKKKRGAIQSLKPSRGVPRNKTMTGETSSETERKNASQKQTGEPHVETERITAAQKKMFSEEAPF